MCGRFTLTRQEIGALARELAAEVAAAEAARYRPRWNVAPTDPHWVVQLEGGRRLLRPARFGLAGPGGRLVINARSETVAASRLFARPLAEGRCLVPADGFYEWRGARGTRRPLWFHGPGRGLLLLAGLAAPAPEGGLAFAILTIAARGAVAEIHDRMPVVLTPDGAAAWLARAGPGPLGEAPPEALAGLEVSERVNAVAHDGPELLEPPTPPRQLTLI